MLFWQELKKILRSLPYGLFVAALVVGLYSQGVFRFRGDLLTEPEPGGNYGTRREEIPELIMPAALKTLWEEFCENDYATYPIGFIRRVKLNGQEEKEMAGILSEVTGLDPQEILLKGSAPAVREGMDYAVFREQMGRADDLLGGGSAYAPQSLEGYGAVPLTYEEARRQYDLAIHTDRVTGGYARLFADYAGVMLLSVLPVFLAVILSLKDRQSEMEALVYTKRVSAGRLVAARYLALVAAAMLPVLVLSYLSNMTVWREYAGMNLDYLAPLSYSLGWLLPSVMTAAAVGLFLTELTGTPAAVAVQGLWWLWDINAGIRNVSEGYALFRLAPRHNAGALSYFRTQEYLDHFGELLQNRLLFAGLALLLAGLTVPVYEAKRKGRFGGNASVSKTIRRVLPGMGNRQNEPSA